MNRRKSVMEAHADFIRRKSAMLRVREFSEKKQQRRELRDKEHEISGDESSKPTYNGDSG